MNTRFIGLDLAWSTRNQSAAVVLEAEAGHARWIAHCDRLGEDAEVLAFVQQGAGSGPALVAIDAPLIVPNQKGARPVDRQITRVFGRFGAGCYPANRNRGCTRGEGIVAALAQFDFVQDPYLQPRAMTRTAFEVYPHPAMVVLFGLERTLKYKARRRRSMDFRRSELARLQSYLVSLHQCEPAMLIPADVAGRDICALYGSAFKHHEDLLDAAVCAYVAYYAWYWGPPGYQIYGDMTQGYILVPMTPQLRDRLARKVNKPQPNH